MPAAGFIGVGFARPKHRRGSAPASFSVTLNGLTNGHAQDGTVLGFTISGNAGPGAVQRWQTSATGAVWTDLPGATGPEQTIDITGGTHGDGTLIRVAVSVDGQARFSNPVRITQVAPMTDQPLSEQRFTENSGLQSYNTSIGFVGSGLRFTVTPAAGVSIDSTTGVLSFDTDLMSVQGGSILTVTATNSGGKITAELNLTIEASLALALEGTGEPPVFDVDDGAVSVTLNAEPFTGSYSTDHTGAPLTLTALQAAPMCLVKPTLAGDAIEGGTLSVTPGLWLYEGADAGDPVWQAQRNGVDIVGANGLSYLIGAADVGADFTVLETYGSAAVTSDPVTIAVTPQFAIEDINEEPVITLESGAVSVTVAAGPYAGSYSTDHTGAPLGVAALQNAPMCLVKPTVSGEMAEGETLTITPGLWLYEGPDLGDQTWQQQLDGVDIPGGTDLNYTLQAADVGRTFSVIESYGDQSVSSESTQQSSTWAGPQTLGAKLHTWLDMTNPTGLFLDQDRTANVIALGDAVNGVADRSGNGNHAESSNASQTSLTWDASTGCLNIKAASRALQGVLPLTGVGPEMEFFVAIKTADTRFMLAGTTASSSHYFGVAAANNGSTVVDGGSGDPTYYVDGTALETPILRSDLFDAWGADVGLVAHASNIDLTQWQAASDRIRYLDYSPFGWIPVGKVTHIIITQALTSQERDNLAAWLQGELPI